MGFGLVTAQEMQAAQILTGVCMAAWLLAGFLRPHATRIRAVVLGLYLTIAVVFVIYVLLR